MSSIEFYDNFISYQINSGINDRIHSLYKRFCRNGIKRNLNILEIGCGIGVLTYLLTRKLKNFKIEAIDISPQSIEYAKKHLSKENILFTSGDILEYEPHNPLFDRVLMFDVLEHIPIDKHLILFKKICCWMSNDCELLINIPNPYYILYDQKNNPQVLQEIDQPLFVEDLVSTISNASLDIISFETHSIWARNDYLFLNVRKRQEFKEQLLSTDRNIVEKVRFRINRKWRRIKYQYPR